MADLPGLEPLFVRLYLDRHIVRRLATDLRGRGFDVMRMEEAGNIPPLTKNSLLLPRQTIAPSLLSTYAISRRYIKSGK